MASNKAANASKTTNKFFEETIIYQEFQLENQIRDASKRGEYCLKINPIEKSKHESFLRPHKSNYTILRSSKQGDENILWFSWFGSIQSLRLAGFIKEDITEIDDIIREKMVAEYIAKVTEIVYSEYLYFISPDLGKLLDPITKGLDTYKVEKLGTFTKKYDIDEFPESKFTKMLENS